tara:strand:+ start:15517 stop:15741 length:225 start_codon:yes stop_codon:yes gene_type:complete
MATQAVSYKVGWMTIKDAALYLGVSERGLKYAVKIKKENKGNQDLEIKSYGNRTLIKVESLDNIEKIDINTPHD